MQTKKIFLASSSELKAEREQFELFLNRKNKSFRSKDLFLELIHWEDFMDSVSGTRLQDEYNKAISDCDVFILIYYSKVGKYSEEEFDWALKTFREKGSPKIYVYCNTNPPPDSQNERHRNSITAFESKLKSIGHFKTEYANIEGLKLHFSDQLDKLANDGFFEATQAGPDAKSLFDEIREKMPYAKSLVKLLDEYEEDLLKIDPDESTNLILFKARYNELEQRILKGILSESDITLHKNQLRSTFLNILENFEQIANRGY